MKRDKSRNKDAMVSFRTDDDFKDGLIKIAKKCELSISQVVKRCVYAHYKQLIEDVSKENTEKQATLKADKTTLTSAPSNSEDTK